MEKLDVDLLSYEEKFYGAAGQTELEENKEDLVDALVDAFQTANKNDLDDKDIIECIIAAFQESNDRKLNIESYRSCLFTDYTAADLKDLPFEQQIKIIGE